MEPAVASVESIYRSHGPVVLRRARRILGNEEESREVLQEIFTALLDDPAQLPKDVPLVGWLYGVTTHKCWNRLRDQRTRTRLLDERGRSEDDEAPPASEGTKLAVRQFLADLPEELMKVAVFHFIDEMTHDEIAVVLQCSRRRVGYLVEEVRAEAKKRYA